MKKILLLLLLFFSCTLTFAQTTEKKTIHVTASPHLKNFLDNIAKQKPSILVEPPVVKEYPQQITLPDTLRKKLLIKEVYPTLTNTIPVWSPGSDYVFNMPGTFAFDKAQVKIHVPRMVTVVSNKKAVASEKNNNSTKE